MIGTGWLTGWLEDFIKTLKETNRKLDTVIELLRLQVEMQADQQQGDRPDETSYTITVGGCECVTHPEPIGDVYDLDHESLP